MRNFVTCHCHPRSLDTASTPKAFREKEKALGTGYLTVTDHGSLSGCREVYDLAHDKKDGGLTPIVGLELYFRDDLCPILLKAGATPNKNGKLTDWWNYGHATIHFLDYHAYETTMRILSKADLTAEKHGSERKPLFNWRDLEEIGAENITMGSGCLAGMVQKHLTAHNNPDVAMAYYDRMRSLVKPGNFFVELFPHTCDRSFVKGVFVTIESPMGSEEIKYHSGKHLRTNVGDITAEQLAKEFKRQKHGGHEMLIGQKDYSKYYPRENPVKILNARYVEDFIMEECRPWSPNGDLQAGTNRFMMELARKYGDSLMISDDSHFTSPNEKIVQDIRLGVGGGWKMSGSYHRRSSEEALQHFRATLGSTDAEVESWVENSHEWAARFKDFKWDSKISLPTKFYPADTLGHTMELIRKHGRMDWNNPQYLERLDREIELFYRNGKIDLLPYFMIDEEVCSLYRDNGLLCGPGRGSASGVLLTYLLGITHINPLTHGLSLERFLTLDRINSGKLPDIDQDLPSRDLLDDPKDGWLWKRFGDHCVQIGTSTDLKLRSAVKDVARIQMGSVPSDIENFTKRFLIPPQGVEDLKFIFGYTDDTNVEHAPALDSDVALQDYIKAYPAQWEIVQMVLGLHRGKGRHACGFIIANQPVSDFIPLTTVKDVRCTDYDKDTCEKVGGVKMDFLEVTSLGDIASALNLIQKRSPLETPQEIVLPGRGLVPRTHLVPLNGQWYDIWDLPDDPAVFEDIVLGKTDTVFQFGGPAAKDGLRHFAHKKPDGHYALDSLSDLAAFTALDRPGPLDATVRASDGSRHNMLIEYAHRARGLPRASGIEAFDGLIPETHDILVYQESVQRIYQHFTGCTGAEAEEFRSFVAKKKQDKIDQAYPFYMARTTAKVGEEKALAIWQAIQTFSQYGFNLSHATCYAAVGYACAWLKHYYPLEWWCSVLNGAVKRGKKDEISEKFWPHCLHYVRLPDIKMSTGTFEIIGSHIQAPLDLLKGIGEAAHQQLSAGAPYTDLGDFCRKILAHQQVTSTRGTKEVVKKTKTKLMGTDGKPLRRDGKMVYETTETTETVETVKLGRSAITQGVIDKLVITGAFDSILPTHETINGQVLEMTIVDQIAYVNKTMGEILGKKPHDIPDIYRKLDQLTRYQLTKSILPMYSVDLIPMMPRGEIPFLVEKKEGLAFQKDRNEYTFVGPDQYRALENIEPFPGLLRVAVACYIEDHLNKPFVRKSDGASKERSEIFFSFEGSSFKAIYWSQDERVPMKFRDKLTSSVVILLMSRNHQNRPFTIEDMCVVRPPLSELTAEDSDDPVTLLTAG